MNTFKRTGRHSLAAAIIAVLAIGAGGAVLALDPRPVAAACPALLPTLPAPGSLPASSSFPDPFSFWDGTRLTTPSDWACRRAQLAELAQFYEYGHLPPAPASVTGARNGGYAEVRIDPNSIAADSTAKTGAFWNLCGASNVDIGVLMAWAWGVHRTLDALAAVPQIDRTKVGVSGYSRYGKAALVAGAFDERIAMTVPGSSGTAGMGNYRFFSSTGSNNETLEDILGAAYWFTPRFAQFRNQSTRLPVDQHSVSSPSPSPSVSPAGCTAAYELVNQWPGGFQARVTVRAGSTALNGWSVRWTFANGQTITQMWDATHTFSAGAVTARAMPYNASVPAGGSVTFGFLANAGATNPAPNPVTCTKEG